MRAPRRVRFSPGRVRATLVLLTAVFLLSVTAQGVAVVAAGDDTAVVEALVGAVAGVSIVLAWLIERRVTGNWVAPALASIGSLTALTRAIELWGAATPDLVGSRALQPLGQAVWPLQVLGVLALLFVFPRGLPPGRFWRRAGLGGPVAAVLILIGMWDSPAGQQAPWPRAALVSFGLLVLALTFAAGVAAVVLRARRGDELTKDQARWLSWAAVVTGVLMVASWFAVEAGLPAEIGYGSWLFGMQVVIPASVAVAVIGHDLFDIDALIEESTAVAAVVTVAAAVWAVTVVAVSQVVSTTVEVRTGVGAFATALILLPTYRVVHRVVSRMIDRERALQRARLSGFVEAVRDGTAQPEEVQQALRRALGDPGLRVGLVPIDGEGYVDTQRTRLDALRTDVRVMAGGTEIAALELTQVSARLRRRAREAAGDVWTVLESCRLRLGLRAAVDEVGSSRARITAAAVEERRRLERDLHDGAQQDVVAVAMRLRSVQRMLPPESPAHADLDRAVDDLAATVTDLRRIAHGLRPSRLDDGLAAALRGLGAASPIPFDLHVGELTGVAADEARVSTAYFVVAEAVTNAWKHASASRVAVRVDEVGGQVHITIEDDGVGGVDDAGSLISLRDRLAAVGGALTVSSTPDAGTLVRMRI